MNPFFPSIKIKICTMQCNPAFVSERISRVRALVCQIKTHLIQKWFYHPLVWQNLLHFLFIFIIIYRFIGPGKRKKR